VRSHPLLTPRRERLARILILAAWWGLVGYFAREVARTRDANGEHLIAAVVLTYLAAWCPVLALARWSPAGKLGRFAACTASIAAGIAIVEAPAALGRVDYPRNLPHPHPPLEALREPAGRRPPLRAQARLKAGAAVPGVGPARTPRRAGERLLLRRHA
jgi:hypothetical protein